MDSEEIADASGEPAATAEVPEETPTEPKPAEPESAAPEPAEPEPPAPEPAVPEPAQPEPVQPEPTEPAPAEPTPEEPAPAEPALAEPAPAESEPTEHEPPVPQPDALPEPTEAEAPPEGGVEFTLKEERTVDENALFSESAYNIEKDEAPPIPELEEGEQTEETEDELDRDFAGSLALIGQGVSTLPSDFDMKKHEEIIPEGETSVEPAVSDLDGDISEIGEEEGEEIETELLEGEEAPGEGGEGDGEVKKAAPAKGKKVKKAKPAVAEVKEKEARRVSRDLTSVLDADFGGFMSDLSFSLAPQDGDDELEVEEEAEEEGEEGEEEQEIMEREPYYYLYDSIMDHFYKVKIKNCFLHKKITEYFRKRKMDHVLRDEEYQQADSTQKYHQKLEQLGFLKELDNTQRTTINTDLSELRELKETKLTMVVDEFKKLQARLREMATGLKFVKSGREITDREIERMVRRQTNASRHITEHRKKYVVARDKVNEKVTALKALETIGEGLHLIDYEQMKVENQGFADKIEERDEDLNRLRNKCTNVTQVLAHLRERSASTTLTMLELQEQVKEVDMEQIEARETVANLKAEREHYRNAMAQLKEQFGLLTKDKLLIDMEVSMEVRDKMKTELKELQETFERQKKELACIRKYMEQVPKKATVVKKTASEDDSKMKEIQYYKHRPSLAVPMMPKHLFGYYPQYEDDDDKKLEQPSRDAL